jgi:hypothetical protein
MHRDVRGHYSGLVWKHSSPFAPRKYAAFAERKATMRRFLAIAAMLLASSGCSFVKVPQGWVLNTGWSLEFHRMPFHASCDRSCTVACESGCNPNCNGEGACPANESGHPIAAPQSIEPAPSLRHAEREAMPEANESSGLFNLLRRRGRLGVCSTCGKLGRFKEPQPAEPATMPVIAKFHPVPAAPVFCPPGSVVATANAVEYQSPASKSKPAQKRQTPPPPQPGNLALPPEPEVLPPPPPAVSREKADRMPRELDVPPEPPDWVFAGSENQLEKAKESQSQSQRSSAPRR